MDGAKGTRAERRRDGVFEMVGSGDARKSSGIESVWGEFDIAHVLQSSWCLCGIFNAIQQSNLLLLDILNPQFRIVLQKPQNRMSAECVPA